jgi:hypothetical protein
MEEWFKTTSQARISCKIVLTAPMARVSTTSLLLAAITEN